MEHSKFPMISEEDSKPIITKSKDVQVNLSENSVSSVPFFILRSLQIYLTAPSTSPEVLVLYIVTSTLISFYIVVCSSKIFGFIF